MKATNLFKIVTLLFLSSCQTHQNNYESSETLGPDPCSQLANIKVIKKIKKTSLSDKSVCFNNSIHHLAKNDLIIAKALWLKRTQGISSSSDFLLEVISYGYDTADIHLQLAQNYYLEKNWEKSKYHLEKTDSHSFSQLATLIDFHLGNRIKNPELLPHIYRKTKINIADITQSNSMNDFNLQMISDGNPNKINGEPSIITSQNGNDIWLIWTDSGQAEAALPDFYYWDLKSAQSTDGGITWSYIDIDTTPNIIDIFHFDPMTAYDHANQIIYAGGMAKSFTSPVNDGIFLYRWNLNDNLTSGPFKHFKPAPDKGLVSVDNNGDVFVAHFQGIEKSTDYGETFNTLISQSYVAPHPRFNSTNCLIITDMEKTSRCSNTGIDTQPQAFSSLSNFGEAGEYIPGSFRVYAMVQNAITNNDEIFAVYTDLKHPNSSETTIYMTKSTDEGQNWSTPWQISPSITGDQFLPWIEIDSNNVIHVVYFDTRNMPQPDTDNTATLDLYYSFSQDLGQTWQETRVTPTSFTTPDLIWGDYFFTDYVSMSVSNSHVYIAFPWSENANQMHMYLATKEIEQEDIIFLHGFEQ